jgi:C2H2-type zinc finger
MPDAICGECSDFIHKLDQFAVKCSRADKMFTDCILQNIQLLDNKTGDFRINYGLENEARATSNKCCDQSTDTTDLETVMQIVNPTEVPSRHVNDAANQPNKLDFSIESVCSMDIKIEVPEEDRSVAALEKICGPESIYEAKEEEDLDIDEECDNDQDLGIEINFSDDVKDDLSLDLPDEKPLMNISSRPVRVKRKVKPPADDDESNQEAETKMFNFNCQTCSDEFSSYTNLAKHCAVMHSSKPRFSCGCGKILSSRTALITHRKWHSKEPKVQL